MHCLNIPSLTRSIPSIRKNSLSRNPPPLRTQETHQRRNISCLGKAIAHSIGLMELDSLGGFLGVEECYYFFVSSGLYS